MDKPNTILTFRLTEPGASEHIVSHWRVSPGAHYEYRFTVGDVEQAKAAVLHLNALGRLATYTGLEDGGQEVYADYPGSLPEDIRVKAAEQWLKGRGDIEILQYGGAWVLRCYSEVCGGFYDSRETAILSAAALMAPYVRGLPLTIDEVIDRYLRHIASGPECATYLRDLGFKRWTTMWREFHERSPIVCEWDSRDYTDREMRMIFDGIIARCDEVDQ